GEVPHLDIDLKLEVERIPTRNLHVEDVGAIVADDGHDGAKRAGRVLHTHLYAGNRRRVFGRMAAPGNIQPIVDRGLGLLEFGTINGVNDGTGAWVHKTDNPVAGQRMAALPERV